MQKRLFLIIMVSCVIFTYTACNSMSPKTQYDKQIESYSSFIASQASDQNIKIKIEDDFYEGERFFEKNFMFNKSCIFNGIKYTGTYEESRYGSTSSYVSDCYYTEDQIIFNLNSDTEEIVYINFSNADFIKTEPYLPEIEDAQKVAQDIAKGIAEQYISNLDVYMRTEEEPSTSYYKKDEIDYPLTYYKTTYMRIVDEIDTSDCIDIIISSKGHIVSVNLNDVNVFKRNKIDVDKLNIDKDLLAESIKSKLETAYQDANCTLIEAHTTQQTLFFTPDGELCVKTILHTVANTDTNVQESDSIIVLTYLSTS